MIAGTGSRFQGRDDIVVHAPARILWQLISDSYELPSWGPPVKSVEVMTTADDAEKLGTARRVHAEFGGKSGYFLEHRVEHVDGRKIGYLIDEESFGLAGLVLRPGFSLELEPKGDQTTRVIFSFFHDPRGFKGRIMNPLIKRQQRRNRLAALASLKRRAEDMVGLQSPDDPPWHKAPSSLA
ncbi:MAG: SRPBCC family protein [Chloroflexi bacterium]|nr:SRPBCC family protein [Chloroflexota bacterium]